MSLDLDTLRREATHVQDELYLEKKQLILYGTELPISDLDPDLLDLSMHVLIETLGYEVDELAARVVRWQNDTLVEAGDYGGGEDLVLAYRGGGKSTIGTICRAIWYALRIPDIRIGFVSETEDLPKAFLVEIKGHLTTNEQLQAMFGQFKPAANDDLRSWEAKKTTILQREAVHLKEPTFHAFGIGGQSAGYHYDVIFPDDLVSYKGSRSATMRQNTSAWYSSTLGGLTMKHTLMHHLGTPYIPGDLWDELENGRRGEKVGPLSESTLTIPAEYRDGNGKRCATSPSRMPLSALDRKLEMIGSIHYGTQFLMDRSKMVGEVFSLADFCYYDPTDPYIDKIRVGWGVYCYFDLKATSAEKSGDYFCGMTIAISPDKKRIDVIDITHFRGGMTKQRRAIIEMTKRHRATLSGVEAVQMQTAFAQEIQEMTILPIEPVKVEHDKVMRAHRVLPLIEAGKVYLPLEDTELGRRLMPFREELVQFDGSPGGRDDTIDAFVGVLTLAAYGGAAPAGGGSDEESKDQKKKKQRGRGGAGLRGRYS